MTRMFKRAPAEMLPAERLREKVFWTGSHMLDCRKGAGRGRRVRGTPRWTTQSTAPDPALACPEQYQTSPNVTPVRTSGAGAPAQPVQDALMVKLPPAGIGGRSAFQEGIGMAQGVNVFMS
jgi:hypothetical protein